MKMEKTEEVQWKKVSMQATSHAPGLKLRRASTDGVPHFQIPIRGKQLEQDGNLDQSPTFRKRISAHSEVEEELNESFSFGETAFSEIDKLQGLFGDCQTTNQKFPVPIRVVADSLCIPQKERREFHAKLPQYCLKFGSLIQKLKSDIKQVKSNLKNFQLALVSERSYWEKFIELIVANQKLQFQKQKCEVGSKIEQLKFQNALLSEKIIHFEKNQALHLNKIQQLQETLTKNKSSHEQIEKSLVFRTAQIQKLLQRNQKLTEQLSQKTKIIEELPSKQKLVVEKQNEKCYLLQIPKTLKGFQTEAQDCKSRNTLSQFSESIFFSPGRAPQQSEIKTNRSYIDSILRQKQVNRSAFPNKYDLNIKYALNSPKMRSESEYKGKRFSSSTISSLLGQAMPPVDSSIKEEKKKIMSKIRKLKCQLKAQMDDVKVKAYVS